MSRSDKEDHVWLSEEGFDQLQRAWGGLTCDVPRVQTRKGSERATSRVDHRIVMVAGERRFHGEFAVDAIGRLQRAKPFFQVRQGRSRMAKRGGV